MFIKYFFMKYNKQLTTFPNYIEIIFKVQNLKKIKILYKIFLSNIITII